MWKNILTIGFSVFITLVLLEVALRFLESAQYEQDIFQQYKGVYSDERDKPYLFGHQSNVNVHLGSDRDGFTFITNSEGLRETQDYNNLDRSVVFLGDSIIEGSAADNDETIDSIFEKKTGIVGINMGLGSSNSIQQFKFLEAKYKASYHSELLLLGICLNDIKQNYFLRYFDPDVGNWKKHSDFQRASQNSETFVSVKQDYALNTLKRFLIQSKLVQFVYYSLFPVRDGELFLASEFTTQEINNTVLLVEDIKRYAEDKGMKLVVTIFPTRSQAINKKMAEGGQIPLFAEMKKRGIATVSLDKLMQEATDIHGAEKVWHDNVHPKPFGYRLVAEYLAEAPEIVDILAVH